MCEKSVFVLCNCAVMLCGTVPVLCVGCYVYVNWFAQVLKVAAVCSLCCLVLCCLCVLCM